MSREKTKGPPGRATQDRLAEGWRQLERDKPERALKVADELVAAEPDAAAPWELRAAALMDLGELEDAAEALGELLEREPGNFEAALERGWLLARELEREDLAAEEMQALVAELGEVLAGGGAEALDAEDREDLTRARAEARLVWAEALRVLYRPDVALAQAATAAQEAPEWAHARASHAEALWDLWRFDEAAAEARAAIALDEDEPLGHWVLGLALERQGDDAGARRAFAEARELDPDIYPEPLGLDVDGFTALANQAFDELPEFLREKIADVPVLVDELPSQEECCKNDPPLSPGVLAIFRGRALPEQSVWDVYTGPPASMTLYRRNALRTAVSAEEVQAELLHTLVHEIGHYFGLDEDDLYERGLN